MTTSLLARRSRSTSPPSSNDSPGSSLSSPSSSDFLPNDGVEPASPDWKPSPSTLSGFSPFRAGGVPIAVCSGQPDFDHASFPVTDTQRLKADSDGEGLLFSEYIQEDAFEPAPLQPLTTEVQYNNWRQEPQASLALSAGIYPPPSFPSTLSSSHCFSTAGAHPATASLLPPQTMLPEQSVQPLDAGPSSSNDASLSNSPHAAPTSLFSGAIYPPKAQCSNLLINITNIPEQGTKSRVETQIKMDLELVMPFASSSSTGAATEMRVASWRWLRLHKGATTKRRPKKDAKQESTTEETLYLSTEVVCATAPNPQVHACSSCIAREAKRVERKKQTRVRPVRSDSEDESAAVPLAVAEQIKTEEQEVDDGSRIVLFNCPELLDFSSGAVSLPVRITCYCRHHREKLGFRVIFTMRDSTGRIVGRGGTPPVMITDDHKTTVKSTVPDEEDGDCDPGVPQPKRKRRQTKKESEQDGDVQMDGQGDGDVEEEDHKAKRRPKAGMSRRKQSLSISKRGLVSGRSSRRGTPSRRSSPSATSTPFVPARNLVNTHVPMASLASTPHPVPTTFDFNVMATGSMPTEFSQPLMPAAPLNPSEMSAMLASLGAVGQTHIQPPSRPPSNTELSGSPYTSYQVPYPVSSPSVVATAPASPLSGTRSLGSPGIVDPSLGMLAGSLLSTNLFASSSPQSSSALLRSTSGVMTQAPTIPSNNILPPSPPPPVIHRLVPSSGPTHGGIEVTILGANFVPNLQCMFGDAVASKTEMWSENTVVALLPPSPSPGPVIVWFKDFANPNGGSAVDGLLGFGGPPMLQWFTYTDSADRALMELALQVVGLKTTGRLEDAKNVAMRIVGAGNGMDLGTGSIGTLAGGGQTMSADSQLADGSPAISAPASRRSSTTDVHPQIYGRSRDFQSVIIELLSLMDVELDEAPSSLPAEAAMSHSTPTGQTLLHLAAILGFHRLVTFLVSRGADVDARDKNGYTALHFAAMYGRLACARILVNHGVDLEVVESRGRSARQIARMHDQADVEALLEVLEAPGGSDYDVDDETSVSAEDQEREDDGEEEDEEPGLWMGTRQASSTANSPGNSTESPTSQQGVIHESRQQSAVPSRTGSHVTFADLHSPPNPASDLYASEDEDPASRPSNEVLPPSIRALASRDAPAVDEKPPSTVDASAAWMHRTLGHLKPPPAMVPDLPWGLGNLQLPGIPAFPVQMQMPGWAVWQTAQGEKGRTYYDLASWRTWYGAAGNGWWSEKPPRAAAAATPVPMYTPSEDEVAAPVAYEETVPQEPQTPGAGPSKAVTRAKLARRLGFDPGELSDKDVDAYAHYSQKMKRLKQDRMLVLFWLPILLIVIAWGVYETLPVAFGALKTSMRRVLPEALRV